MGKPFNLANLLEEQNSDSMIQSITIRDVATYDKTGVVFNDLKRVNFIYGGNGCGKTTLSRLLEISGQARSLKEGPYKHCRVEWTGNPLKVLVYNKDFREKNLCENIPGVFTLGEASVEAMKEMERLRQQQSVHQKTLTDKQKQLASEQRKYTTQSNRLHELLKQTIDRYRPEFEDCFDEFDDMQRLIDKVSARVHDGTYRKTKTHEELVDGYRSLFEGLSPMYIYPLHPPVGDYNELKLILENEIWKRSVVGSSDIPIAQLIEKLGISDWVRQGRDVLVKSEKLKVKSDVCPFCQQHTITEYFREELETFFDIHYQKDIEAIRQLLHLYNEYAANVMNGLRSVEEFAPFFSNDDGFDGQLYRAKVDTLKERLYANRRIIISKFNHPGLVVTFKKTDALMDEILGLLNKANQVIDEHNRVRSRLDDERKAFVEEVWRFLAAQVAEEMKIAEQAMGFNQERIEALQAGVDEALAETKRIGQEIYNIEKRMASIQPTVNRINNALKKSGFSGFRIIRSKKGNCYQIEREDGTLATHTLSEGETTFISFLYFMQLAQGGVSKNKITEPRVLVLDDPISSLDSNVLFVVSTMIRGLLQDLLKPKKGKAKGGGIEQIFVLTHNVYFHKVVSLLNARTNKHSDVYHWILYKNGNVTSLRECEHDNPIRGSYELLWKQLRDWQEKMADMDNITIQNVMRRIIEYYFVMMGGWDKKSLVPENFSSDPEELAILSSFARWYDEGSHGTLEDFYMEAPQIANEKYMSVFRQLFISLGHEAHYKMMMRI